MSTELDRTRQLWEMSARRRTRTRPLGDHLEGPPLHGRRHLRHRPDGVVDRPLARCTLDGARAVDGSLAAEPSTLDLTVDALAQLAAIPARAVIGIARSAGEPVAPSTTSPTRSKAPGRFGKRVLASTPTLSIEGSIGRQRRWAVARCSLADVKTVRKTFGGSVNDVVLTAITSGFRDLLLRRGDPIDDVTLTSLVPVSVRAEHDHSHNNQVSLMLAELPIGVDDLIDRLHAVRSHMHDLKASHQADAGAAAFDAADLLPPALFSMGAQAAQAMFRRAPQHTVNTVTTNVPGPPFPLFLLGREMFEYAPFVPLSEGVRIGVAILSYNGQICFGITGDYDAAPDVEFMAERIEASIDELCRAAAAKEAEHELQP